MQHLIESKLGKIFVVEPHLENLPPQLTSPDVEMVEIEEALQQADLVVLLVNHRVFAHIDRNHLQGKEIIDTRGLWS